ncbi:MAG: hypothetical protein COU90_00365 [Candidatus Ryanbacteria bacterium CG10_big_fil_rev_8_21_14_0_10_43_42]|uniref:SHS2 domain-containing protein n=1 Tax=Candidatus Ryanbacteria bacterium CG10_big_fil_rev_8_21_14_0_10_43_42 TaxID=1974864 RepID=A0A2M8KXQ4_9BACT|nr:MAG: hypothetical protein COU90_00365 [Candidatus Ryanbacteria bacterium CG10_big_fil_rev_8_21_14_0_10_43_42]
MDIPFFQSGKKKGLSLFDKKTSVLGIDIGSASIKLIQLRLERERAILETYGELAAGPYNKKSVGQGVHLPDTKVSEVIADLVRETGATTRSVVVGVPLRNSFVTSVSIPPLSAKDLKMAMQYEARRYIPIPVSEVVIDWWRIPDDVMHDSGGNVSTAANQAIDVLLVAVPKDVIEKYRRIVAQAGLDPIAFEIEVFSSIRSAVRREQGGALLVDFGAVTTNMTILEKGIVRSSHSFDRGFQTITIGLAESMGVNFERAELMKREVGLSSRLEHQGTRKVIAPLLDYMLIELERFATGYTRKYGGTISKIYITGGGASMPGLVDHIVKKFGVEVILGNPFGKVEYPAFFQPVLKEIGPSFSNAVGLALRGLQ